MPRGSKAKHTEKERRQAKHIETQYEQHGLSAKEALRRAWATVNKDASNKAKTNKKSSVLGSRVSASKTHLAPKRKPGRPKGSRNKTNH